MKAEDVKISSPHKLLFPDDGLRKEDVADYYRRIAPFMLPWLTGHPVTLKRYTEGIGKAGFYNKHAPPYFPAHLDRIEVPMRSRGGKPMYMVCVDEAADLVYLAGQNVIELHMGLSRQGALDCPDQLVIDFDPSDGDFAKVRRAALELKGLLDERGLPSFLKTSGSRGLHVHLPLLAEADFDRVKPAARALAEALQARCPKLTTLEMRKDKRGDKVFIDWLRNDYSNTAIAPYSLRALPGAPLATPLDWAELRNGRLHAQSYTVKNIFRRLAQKQDPWREFDASRVALPQL